MTCWGSENLNQNCNYRSHTIFTLYCHVGMPLEKKRKIVQKPPLKSNKKNNKSRKNI